MGRSCTAAAAASLTKATSKLCRGGASNVYRLDMGDGETKQFHFEDWTEYGKGGMKLDIYEHQPDGTARLFSEVRIGADGGFDGGPLVWSLALRDNPVLATMVLTPT